MKPFNIHTKFNFVRGGVLLILFSMLCVKLIAQQSNNNIPNPCNIPAISGKISERFPNISQIANPSILIDGELEIDKNFDFVGLGTIYLTPNSKIIINESIIFKIWDHVTVTNCGDPWNSIELVGSSSRLFVSVNSKIEGAEIGIKAENGGIIDIVTSTIKNCNTLISLGGKFTTRIRSNSVLEGGDLSNGTSTYNGVYINENDNSVRVFSLKESEISLPPTSPDNGILVIGNYSTTMNFSIEKCKFKNISNCIKFQESAAIKSIKNTSFSIPISVDAIYAINNTNGSGVTMESDTLYSELRFNPALQTYIYPQQYLFYDKNIEYSGTTINNCVFKNFLSGIYSYNCNKRHTISNCKFENVLHGISINNYKYTKKLVNNYINNNTFTSTHIFGLPTSEAAYPIYIDDQYSFNEIKLNNFFFIGGKVTGIYLANVTNGSLISENIFSNSNKFITPGVNTCIYFAGSPGNISRYNYTNRYSRGQTFIGPVENTKFNCNQFDFHNDGLLINYGSIIGPQKHQWNTWTSGYSNFGASNWNTENNIVKLSKFTVGTPLGTIYHPTNDPDGFFEYEEKNPNYNFCNNMVANPGDEEKVALKRIVLTSSSNPNLQSNIWENKKYAFKRLLEDASLMSQDAELQNFYSNNQNTSIGQFANISHIMGNMDDILPYPNVEALFDQIATKLSLLNELIEQENENNNSQINLLQNEIFSLNTQLKNQENSNLNQINITLSHLLQINQSISTSNSYESNLKIINEIILTSLLNPNVTNAQKAVITAISEKCLITEGSSAVLLARAVYGLNIDHQRTFDDYDNDCAQMLIAPRSNNTKEEISETYRIIPNPSLGIFRVDWKETTTVDYSLYLYDIHGKLIQKARLPLGIRSYNMDISDEKSGIYLLKLQSGEGKTLTQKIVLIK